MIESSKILKFFCLILLFISIFSSPSESCIEVIDFESYQSLVIQSFNSILRESEYKIQFNLIEYDKLIANQTLEKYKNIYGKNISDCNIDNLSIIINQKLSCTKIVSSYNQNENMIYVQVLWMGIF